MQKTYSRQKRPTKQNRPFPGKRDPLNEPKPNKRADTPWMATEEQRFDTLQQHTATTLCNKTLLQRNATTHCINTLQQHTATTQHSATTHCNNTPQQLIATHCNKREDTPGMAAEDERLQHTATTHCNTLCRHTATTNCNTTLQRTTTPHSLTHCDTLRYTATHCNTLQHTATHCYSTTQDPRLQYAVQERWGAGVETQKNVRGEIGGWGRVPFNEIYAPSLSTIYDGA